MARLSKALYHAVIRNGNRLMPPVMGALKDRLYLGHPVHLAHLRVAMKLYPFLRRQILP